MACVRRSAWAAAGVFIALAVLSQQFAVLVAVPLLVLAPGLRKLTYAAGALGAAVLVTVPLAVANARGTAHAVIFGTGTTGGIGGTVLWEMNLHGASLVLLSRIAPIAFSLLIAWWTVRRVGTSAAVEPVALVSLIAVCVSLRLVFEQQLFGYYFMALSVSLIVLDVVRGQLRSTMAAWLATTSVVYLLGSTQLDALGSPKLTLARCLLPLSVMVFAAIPHRPGHRPCSISLEDRSVGCDDLRCTRLLVHRRRIQRAPDLGVASGLRPVGHRVGGGTALGDPSQRQSKAETWHATFSHPHPLPDLGGGAGAAGRRRSARGHESTSIRWHSSVSWPCRRARTIPKA